MAENKSKSSIIRLLLDDGRQFTIWSMMIILIVMIIDITLPLFNQVLTDSILTRRHPEWIEPMSIMLLGLSLSYVLVVVLLYYFKRRLQVKVFVVIAAKYFWTSLRFPISVFGRINAATLNYRLGPGIASAQVLTHDLPKSIVAIIQIVIMLLIMLMYSPLLSLVSLGCLVVNLGITLGVSKHQKLMAKDKEQKQNDLTDIFVSSINNIESIKAAGAESAYFRKLMHYFSVYQESTVRMNKQAIMLSMFPLIIENITTILTICLGATLIINGDITVGILIAFQSFLGQFICPLLTISRQAQTIISDKNKLDRFYEIVDIPTEVPSAIDYVPAEKLDKLTGLIELKDVTFGYDRSQPPLIEHLSITIHPGQSLALVGGSGSGKSTIANLISGLYEPWEGEILFDGKPRKAINRHEFYNSVAVINQDIVLFDGTVADNIKMWDDITEDFAMVMAADAAQIHADIAQRPDAYNSPVGNSGSNFSGGQRQRIEIATAMTKEPTILIMDEATSALDPFTEEKVMQNIRKQGITTIIVAHRLSTIRDCQEIMVINNGVIEGRGTHDQLMQNKDGLYYKLMQMN